ncbi:MAG TPA: hypothetical protein VMT47_15010 [Polyangia bacterium]|nr:hypothetical protein [Polyangia bacterium]
MSASLTVSLEALLRDVIRDAVREEMRAIEREEPGRSGVARRADAIEAPMTTTEASRYCGFKSAVAIRKALFEGRLVPIGRRGETGTYMWSRQALDAFLAGARDGSLGDGLRPRFVRDRIATSLSLRRVPRRAGLVEPTADAGRSGAHLAFHPGHAD